jgi:hypothetical protein
MDSRNEKARSASAEGAFFLGPLVAGPFPGGELRSNVLSGRHGLSNEILILSKGPSKDRML